MLRCGITKKPPSGGFLLAAKKYEAGLLHAAGPQIVFIRFFNNRFHHITGF
jgi:hypothetical protein